MKEVERKKLDFIVLGILGQYSRKSQLFKFCGVKFYSKIGKEEKKKQMFLFVLFQSLNRVVEMLFNYDFIVMIIAMSILAIRMCRQ